MINCTVLNITQIIVILILLTVLLIQNCGKKRRNKLLKGIDMTILEISIPGCESFCFYIHPDRETAAKCEIGCEYPLNIMMTDTTDSLSIFYNDRVYILNTESENCSIRITDKQIMPSGDPMLLGVLIDQTNINQ